MNKAPPLAYTAGMLATAFLSLGANLGDRALTLLRAVDELAALPRTSVARRSSLYQTEPWGNPAQPPFLNLVVQLHTALPPLDLLDAAQRIEHAHGRRRDTRWGERTLDIDILLYDDQRIDHPRLQVPHARLHLRNFVLVPLVELAAELPLPGSAETARSLLARCPDTGQVLPFPPTSHPHVPDP